jgi:hypothetical protein
MAKYVSKKSFEQHSSWNEIWIYRSDRKALEDLENG